MVKLHIEAFFEFRRKNLQLFGVALKIRVAYSAHCGGLVLIQELIQMASDTGIVAGVI